MAYTTTKGEKNQELTEEIEENLELVTEYQEIEEIQEEVQEEVQEETKEEVPEVQEEFFNDDDSFDDDSNESETKVKTKRVSKVLDEVEIKRVPSIGEKFKAPSFAIEIVGSKDVKEGKEFECKITWATAPCKMKVGDIFTAKEIAFYSDYYKQVVNRQR